MWRSINSSPLNPAEDLMDNQSGQSPGDTPLNANFKFQNCPNTRSSAPCGAHRFLAPTWLVGKPTRTGGALSAEERKRRGSKLLLRKPGLMRASESAGWPTR